MTLFNVSTTVVELIDAGSPDEAVAKLRKLLIGHGFSPYEGDDGGAPAVFESEDLPSGEEASTPHATCWVATRAMRT